MKRTLLILLCFWFAATLVKAQDVKVSLSPGILKAKDIFRSIESQTDFRFAFGYSSFDVSKEVHVTERQATVKEILGELLQGTGSNYRVDGRQILIIPKEMEKQPREKMIIRPFDWSLSYSDKDFETDAREDSIRLAALQAVRSGEAVEDVDMLIITDSVFGYPSKVIKMEGVHGLERIPTKPAYTPNHFFIKTDLLHGIAALAPNLGVETGIGSKTSLGFSGGFNDWEKKHSQKNRKLRHWYVEGGLRYWLCKRFEGHYLGADISYWEYNVSDHAIPLLFKKRYQYEGNAVGIAVSYGYHWIWSKRWGMEFSVGAGVAFLRYDKYECEWCGDKQGRYSKTYLGPARIGIKLTYMIK